MADSEAKKKWMKEHTTNVAIKLNHKTDADIIARLDREANKGGYIKQLIRKDIAEQDDNIAKLFSE